MAKKEKNEEADWPTTWWDLFDNLELKARNVLLHDMVKDEDLYLELWFSVDRHDSYGRDFTEPVVVAFIDEFMDTGEGERHLAEVTLTELIDGWIQFDNDCHEDNTHTDEMIHALETQIARLKKHRATTSE
jgi:hypothetical protein